MSAIYDEFLKKLAEKYPDIFYINEDSFFSLNVYAYCNKCHFKKTYCFGNPSCLKKHFPPRELYTNEKHKCEDYPVKVSDELMRIVEIDAELANELKGKEKFYQFEMETSKFNSKCITVKSVDKNEALEKILHFVQLNTHVYDDIEAYKKAYTKDFDEFLKNFDSPELPVNSILKERWEKTKQAKTLHDIIEIWTNEFDTNHEFTSKCDIIYLP